MKHVRWTVMALTCAQLGSGIGFAAEKTNENNAAPQKIGIFDSRAVAYAHFWTRESQQRLEEQKKAAAAAKAAGDMAKFNQLGKALADEQDRLHREVFSTAPPVEALAALQSRLSEIQKQAGVDLLVSKWDEPSLRAHPSATRADVTDLLVQEFQPTEKQLKTIAEIKKRQPVPLSQIDRAKND